MPYKDREKLLEYHRKYNRENYKAQKEYHDKRNRKWVLENPEKLKAIRKKNRVINRELLSQQSKEYRLKNPEKYKAHLIMKNAIRRGELIPQPCEICGKIKSQGHHDDYNYPLKVRWLCIRHHNLLHHPVKHVHIYEEFAQLGLL